MQQKVKQWLEDGTIDVFLGYKKMDNHSLPHCFTQARIEEVDDLVISLDRYPLEKIAAHMTALKPDLNVGMLARDCNQRALNVLYIWNQLNPDQIHPINVNCCPSPLKEQADCSYLKPAAVGGYKREEGVDNTFQPEAFHEYGQEERLARWMYEFQKCIKCYGCRNICPVCFCKECSLEHGDLIGNGALPPEVPVFHLIRAVHMAGRCIDCGLCEDACPMDIPLRLLYRKVNEIVTQVFDYKTGTSATQSPFNILGDTVTLEPKPIQLSGTDNG
ncbi:MAG: 4Fe-4S binding protein [Desulfatiglandaceae bacterium]